MLVLARKSPESVVIASANDLQELVRVTVVGISRGKVKLGFAASNDLAIHREEVWERVCQEFLDRQQEQEVDKSKCHVPDFD
jgi:carbon storage regulator